MGLFDSYKKKSATVDNRPWVDKHYMPGYDVGEIIGYTDLPDKPPCDEEGTQGILKWNRYGDIIVITDLTTKRIGTVNIPKTINGYTVAGIGRMAFLHCRIRSIIIPETVEYIGGMAIGFTCESPFTDDEERKMREQKPFAENWPTSPFMYKEFFVHSKPKTTIIGTINTTAEKYATVHHLPFLQN